MRSEQSREYMVSEIHGTIEQTTKALYSMGSQVANAQSEFDKYILVVFYGEDEQYKEAFVKQMQKKAIASYAVEYITLPNDALISVSNQLTQNPEAPITGMERFVDQFSESAKSISEVFQSHIELGSTIDVVHILPAPVANRLDFNMEAVDFFKCLIGTVYGMIAQKVIHDVYMCHSFEYYKENNLDYTEVEFKQYDQIYCKLDEWARDEIDKRFSYQFHDRVREVSEASNLTLFSNVFFVGERDGYNRPLSVKKQMEYCVYLIFLTNNKMNGNVRKLIRDYYYPNRSNVARIGYPSVLSVRIPYETIAYMIMKKRLDRFFYEKNKSEAVVYEDFGNDFIEKIGLTEEKINELVEPVIQYGTDGPGKTCLRVYRGAPAPGNTMAKCDSLKQAENRFFGEGKLKLFFEHNFVKKDEREFENAKTAIRAIANAFLKSDDLFMQGKAYSAVSDIIASLKKMEAECENQIENAKIIIEKNYNLEVRDKVPKKGSGLFGKVKLEDEVAVLLDLLSSRIYAFYYDIQVAEIKRQLVREAIKQFAQYEDLASNYKIMMDAMDSIGQCVDKEYSADQIYCFKKIDEIVTAKINNDGDSLEDGLERNLSNVRLLNVDVETIEKSVVKVFTDMMREQIPALLDGVNLDVLSLGKNMSPMELDELCRKINQNLCISSSVGAHALSDCPVVYFMMYDGNESETDNQLVKNYTLSGGSNLNKIAITIPRAFVLVGIHINVKFEYMSFYRGTRDQSKIVTD